MRLYYVPEGTLAALTVRTKAGRTSVGDGGGLFS